MTLGAGYMDPDKDILDFKPDPLIATERIERRDWL